MPIAEVLRNTSPAMANRALPGPVNYAQIAPLAERGLARLQHFLTVLNERLQDREFIAAQQFSVADITAVVALDFARIVKVRPDERHPHLTRWRTAMAQRPLMGL
jgi:glutathione S-transferase